MFNNLLHWHMFHKYVLQHKSNTYMDIFFSRERHLTLYKLIPYPLFLSNLDIKIKFR